MVHKQTTFTLQNTRPPVRTPQNTHRFLLKPRAERTGHMVADTQNTVSSPMKPNPCLFSETCPSADALGASGPGGGSTEMSGNTRINCRERHSSLSLSWERTSGNRAAPHPTPPCMRKAELQVNPIPHPWFRFHSHTSISLEVLSPSRLIKSETAKNHCEKTGLVVD